MLEKGLPGRAASQEQAVTDATVRIQREKPRRVPQQIYGGILSGKRGCFLPGCSSQPARYSDQKQEQNHLQNFSTAWQSPGGQSLEISGSATKPSRGWTKVSSSGSSCDAAFPALYPELTPWLLSYCSVTGFLQGENKLHPEASASHSDRFPSHQQHFFPPTRKSSEELNVTKPFIWHFSYKRHKLLATNIVENYHHRYSA